MSLEEFSNWYPVIMLTIAFTLQAATVLRHWQMARTFGWLPPLVLSSVGMTTMLVPRVITMLYTEKMFFVDLKTVNVLNASIYVWNSTMFFLAISYLAKMLYRDRNLVMDRILDEDRLRQLAEDMAKMQIGFVDYWQMAESLPDGAIMTDDQGVILYVNRALIEMLGFSRTQLIAQSLTLLIPARLREAHQNKFEAYAQTHRRTIRWQSYSMPVLKADGSELDCEISFSEFMADGHRRFVGIIRARM